MLFFSEAGFNRRVVFRGNFPYVALVAVVGRLVLDPTLVGNLFAVGYQLVSQDLNVLDGLQQAVSARQVRREADAIR